MAFTRGEAAAQQVEDIAAWVLIPYPGEKFSVDSYDNGLYAVYGVWNLTQTEDRGLMAGDHVRVSFDPETPGLIFVDRIPATWPTHAALAPLAVWDDLTQGQDYSHTDETLYDLGPTSWTLSLDDLM